ncbi:MAG: hypothetical protein AAFP90_12005 [Planctomycetota bacterium]
MIDLNGFDTPGIDTTPQYKEDDPGVSLAPNAEIVVPPGVPLSAAIVEIDNPLDAPFEILSVDTTGTDIIATFDADYATLYLDGFDTPDNYASVIRTLIYENTDMIFEDTRFVDITIGNRDAASPTVFAYIAVTPTNDRPILNLSEPFALNALDKDDMVSVGTGVDEILGGTSHIPIFDLDPGALTGIALIGVDRSAGQ